MRRARDDLFTDAVLHGPRASALALRIAPAWMALVASMLATLHVQTRDSVAGWTGSINLADSLLTAPIVLSLVMFASAVAPVARMRPLPTVLVGAALLATAEFLMIDGRLVESAMLAGPACLLFGVAASRAVQRVIWLVPMLAAITISDIYSVTSGTTAVMIEQITRGAGTAPPSLSRSDPAQLVPADFVMLHAPAISGTWVLGFADIVALGMLFGISHRYWLPNTRTAAALAIAMLGGSAAGVPVPLLPLLAIAWVTVHHRLIRRAITFSVRRFLYLGGD